MVDTLLGPSTSDPLGATGAEGQPPQRPQPTHSPSLPPYSPGLGKSRLLTVTYSPPSHGDATPHTALIPWTNQYETALASAKEALEHYFPRGSANRRRWLASRLQTSSGLTWAEFRPEIFAHVVEEPGVELRLCEERTPKIDVNILPIGHEQQSSDEPYYQFKIITIGQRSVGKSMMLQCFTLPEESREETLSSTLAPRMDIANRFMTAHGELIKTILWDTAGQETFRAMTKPLYRGANGVFLVYSIANSDTFRSLPEWLTEIRNNVDENVPIMLIGNQVDRVTERAVETSEGQAFALEHGLLFAEISGKEGINVDQAFRGLVHEIFHQAKDRDELYKYKETPRSARARRLENPPPRPWYGKCCNT